MTQLELRIFKLTRQYNSKVYNKKFWNYQSHEYREDFKRIEAELIEAIGELNHCPFIPLPKEEHLTIETYLKK